MKTRVTELLNIEYPVIQGGMAWVADAQQSRWNGIYWSS